MRNQTNRLLAVAVAIATGTAGCGGAGTAIGATGTLVGLAAVASASSAATGPGQADQLLSGALGSMLLLAGVVVMGASLATAAQDEEAAARAGATMPSEAAFEEAAEPGRDPALAVDPDPTVAQMVMAARAGRCVEAAERARRLATRTPTRLARVIDRDDAVARCLRDGGYKM